MTDIDGTADECLGIDRTLEACAQSALSPKADMCALPALDSLQQVQVVTIRVLETDHAGTPGLVLRRIVELHASRSQRRIECINIRHGQADVIDARRIAEQA